MNILTVVGARPQFIKACAISRAIMNDYQGVSEIIVHTGQHYDKNMSGIFFNDLGLPVPKYNLDINQGSHAELTARIMERLELVLKKENPDWVLVYGDTDSTLAAALTAAKLHIRVAHVEAGLRSYNKLMPEEVNRVLTDHLSSLNFCPTANAVENLRKEGFPRIAGHGHLIDRSYALVDTYGRVEISSPLTVNVGDVMYDVLQIFRSIASNKRNIREINGLKIGEYAVATIHREENTASINSLEFIMDKLLEFSEHTELIMPVHPRTRKMLQQHGKWATYYNMKRMNLISPLAYMEMIRLVDEAAVVITDSGGLQKEAFLMNVPCLTIREETEWVETVQAGKNLVVGSKPANLVQSYRELAVATDGNHDQIDYFGDGFAAHRIVEIIQRFS